MSNDDADPPDPRDFDPRVDVANGPTAEPFPDHDVVLADKDEKPVQRRLSVLSSRALSRMARDLRSAVADDLIPSAGTDNLVPLLHSFLYRGVLPDGKWHMEELRQARDLLLAVLPFARTQAWEAGARLDECAQQLRSASVETLEAVGQDIASLCLHHVPTADAVSPPEATTDSLREELQSGKRDETAPPMTTAQRKKLERERDRAILETVGGQELRFFDRLDAAAGDAAYLCLRLLDEAARHGIDGRSRIEAALRRAWNPEALKEREQTNPEGLGPREAVALAHLLLAYVLKCLFPSECIKGTRLIKVLPVWLTTLSLRAADLPGRVDLSALGLSPSDYERTVQHLLQHERMPAIGLSSLVGGGRGQSAGSDGEKPASLDRRVP
jgi:hypothetical protein